MILGSGSCRSNMVLLLEDDSAIIEVRDGMPDGYGEKFSLCLPPSSSVQELYTSVINYYNYNPESCDLLLVNDHVVSTLIHLQSILLN